MKIIKYSKTINEADKDFVKNFATFFLNHKVNQIEQRIKYYSILVVMQAKKAPKEISSPTKKNILFSFNILSQLAF